MSKLGDLLKERERLLEEQYQESLKAMAQLSGSSPSYGLGQAYNQITNIPNSPTTYTYTNYPGLGIASSPPATLPAKPTMTKYYVDITFKNKEKAIYVVEVQESQLFFRNDNDFIRFTDEFGDMQYINVNEVLQLTLKKIGAQNESESEE